MSFQKKERSDITKSKKKYEVEAIVASGKLAQAITDKELFSLYCTFNCQLKILRGPEDQITIFSLTDAGKARLVALLPFMPAFREQRVIIDTQRMIKIKLSEEFDQMAK
jgi:hypothetical protein